MQRPQISDRGILVRINRALESKGRGEQLHRARRQFRRQLGTYYLAGSAGEILRARIQLDVFAEEVGVARPYQARQARAADRRQRERDEARAAEEHAAESGDHDDEETAEEEDAYENGLADGQDQVISNVMMAIEGILRSCGPDEKKFIERLIQRLRFEDPSIYWR